ncbi:hypothetical protein IC229_08875 [Spirosoma sp. BT702]|uniref:Uncharacterized protein n=1 Tax=Spirosoma profusum TaxID=2771354 RepID=A0A926XUM9_9BACT|nr:hypothetical protein [Spirosoma profusum]MBD2700748.1 hypothetical protein [Spirosoma profusum]
MIKFGYDILFSIRLLHDYYEGATSDMTIVPTADCEETLRNHGLLFRSISGGGLILFSLNEKNEIHRKIQALSRFRFLIILRNATFNNFTNLSYPAKKLGRKIYYFSNVANNGVIDASTTLPKGIGNKIDSTDLYWLVNPILKIPLGGNFNQVTLSRIMPGSGKTILKTFQTAVLEKLVIDLQKIDNTLNSPLALKEGNYILDFSGPSPKTEQIYFDVALWKSNAWGLIEIMKDNTINYAAKTEYTITAKANPWSYYLIDPANKVTINNNTLTNVSTATTGLAGLALTWVQEADLEADSYEQRRYAQLKNIHTGTRIFLLRSNRGMPRTAESKVSVKLTLDGVQRTLPNPKGTQSIADIIQTL